MRGVELCADEREVISRELAKDESFRGIGRILGRDHSIVSREVNRNGGREAYRAVAAQSRASACRVRPKSRLLESNTALHDVVNDGGVKWS
jgi:IS30 family transposase